jgi:hypothetical protein
MSFSGLSNLFNGRVGATNCLAMLLSLKSPKNAKKYLIQKHREINCYASSYKDILTRWKSCPSSANSNIKPILDTDLEKSQVTNKIAETMSFDISRFIDFIEGYARVSNDIKPVMLHYSTMYLLDFFSRTWLRCEPSTAHGLKVIDDGVKREPQRTKLQILKKGFFPRIVDSFVIMNQHNLFSNDNTSGIQKNFSITKDEWEPELEKKCYSREPKISLGELLNIYELLKTDMAIITMANKILTGYLILFLISSISRYKAKKWCIITNDRNLSNEIELVNYDFVSKWIPELILQKKIFS